MRQFNCKIKYYSSTRFSITTYNYGNRYDYEKSNDKNNIEKDNANISRNIKDIINDIERACKVSQNRAKNKIYDYARSNDFEYFITLTFDPLKVDSFDYSVCTKKLSKWLEHLKSRYAPDLKYLVVPELHKSGRYHFHGLFGNCGDIAFVDSGKTTLDGNIIYNIGNYKMGFTTATKILDMSKTATYIGKYITKELSGHLKNKKHYWNSRNLLLPQEVNCTLDELLDMGIDREFLENNSIYHKEVNYECDDYYRRVNYYEFERNE